MPNPNKVLNPDAAILQQLDGQWQKIALFLIIKMVGREKITLNYQDMKDVQESFGPSGPFLLTHGHKDSIDFQVVDEETAKRLAEYDKTMRGTA